MHIRNLVSVWSYIAILANILLFVRSEWVKLTVSPSAFQYSAIVWPFDGIALAAGNNVNGAIIRSTNRGVSWYVILENFVIPLFT